MKRRNFLKSILSIGTISLTSFIALGSLKKSTDLILIDVQYDFLPIDASYFTNSIGWENRMKPILDCSIRLKG